MRLKKILLVLCAWSIVFLFSCVLGYPIIYTFTVEGMVPNELAAHAVFAAVALILPILYAASFILAPLIFATLEAFQEDEH